MGQDVKKKSSFHAFPDVQGAGPLASKGASSIQTSQPKHQTCGVRQLFVGIGPPTPQMWGGVCGAGEGLLGGGRAGTVFPSKKGLQEHATEKAPLPLNNHSFVLFWGTPMGKREAEHPACETKRLHHTVGACGAVCGAKGRQGGGGVHKYTP